MKTENTIFFSFSLSRKNRQYNLTYLECEFELFNKQYLSYMQIWLDILYEGFTMLLRPRLSNFSKTFYNFLPKKIVQIEVWIQRNDRIQRKINKRQISQFFKPILLLNATVNMKFNATIQYRMHGSWNSPKFLNCYLKLEVGIRCCWRIVQKEWSDSNFKCPVILLD